MKPAYDLYKKSRPIEVIPYQPRWVAEFGQIAGHIREVVGDAAIRIDHIGSTAVPGLAAKDVIDIQITVANLDQAGNVTRPLTAAGFRRGGSIEYDHFHGLPETDAGLRKRYMREREGDRRIHIHIREGVSDLIVVKGTRQIGPVTLG